MSNKTLIIIGVVVFGVIVGSDKGYINLNFSGINSQKQTPIEQINTIKPTEIIPTSTPSFTSEPIPRVIIYEKPEDDEGLTSNQEMALESILRQQKDIAEEIKWKTDSVRQLLGDDVVDNPAIVFQNLPKYLERCDEYCIQMAKKLLQEGKELQSRYDQLEITRLQILGQK